MIIIIPTLLAFALGYLLGLNRALVQTEAEIQKAHTETRIWMNVAKRQSGVQLPPIPRDLE